MARSSSPWYLPCAPGCGHHRKEEGAAGRPTFYMDDELGTAYLMSPLDTAIHQAMEQHAAKAVLQNKAQTKQPYFDLQAVAAARKEKTQRDKAQRDAEAALADLESRAPAGEDGAGLGSLLAEIAEVQEDIACRLRPVVRPLKLPYPYHTPTLPLLSIDRGETPTLPLLSIDCGEMTCIMVPRMRLLPLQRMSVCAGCVLGCMPSH